MAGASAVTVGEVSESELGAFLRSRREALAPAAAGLPAGPRRRAPGLRRSEVAMLAGVSVEYLTRLEQGRDRHPSAQVLSALAEALALTLSERTRLYYLAKASDASFNCKGSVPPARDVRPAVRAVLSQLEPAPALVVNRLSDVLASTDGYRCLMAPAGLMLDRTLPGTGLANLARYVFTHPQARSVFPDWQHVADEQVAALKRGPFRADRHIAALADELTVSAGDEFARRAEQVPGFPRPSGILRLDHPQAGGLRLAYETLDLADDDQRLIVYLPADPGTSAALGLLNARPPRALGLVSG
jgi:transcriptional regulator with XRE-family HTH domain